MDQNGPSRKDVLLDAIEQTIGSDALETTEPDSPGKLAPEETEQPLETPICITQSDPPVNFEGGTADIFVGLDAEIPRWVPGSVVKWAAWRAGFDSQEDANYAATQLDLATQVWNRAKVGVQFEWVRLAKDANFVLCHGGAKGSCLARAFFPSNNHLNYVYVYKAAFRRDWAPFMWKIFTHELGHVLGLRHEFALREESAAVQLGPRNELSVMNYRQEAPELQLSDIKSTRLFYSLRDDAQGEPPSVGGTPIADYTPR